MLKNKITKKFLLNTLKQKIITIILSISIFNTLVGLLLLYSFDIPNRLEELKSNAKLILEILSENSALPLYSFDKEQLNSILQSSSKEEFIKFALIITDSHDTIVKYQKQDYTENSAHELIPLAKDIKLNNQVLGTLHIMISKERLQLRSKEYLITSIIILILTILISLILGTKLQTLISDPIVRLSKIAKKISSNNHYNITITKKSNDETGILYDEFNNMLYKIKQRESEILNARKFLNDVLNSIPSALLTVNPELKITSINKAAIKLSTAEQETLTECPLNIAFPLFQDQFVDIDNNKNSAIRKIEKNINGKRCYFDIGFYPLKNSEDIIIRIDNVTKQVGFENLMMQTEKIMSVGGLAAGMAHEINNPLGVVIQTAQNIERRISPNLKSNIKAANDIDISINKIQEYMEKREILNFIEDIKESGNRAADIVKNMLKFSHKSDSRKSPVKIDEIIDNSIKLAGSDFNLKKQYDFKNIKIIKEYTDKIPIIIASETEMEQVFLNLLKNSVQAMSNQKNKSTIIIRINTDNSKLKIEFEDNGPGMNKYTRKHLFEPFYTTKPVGEGTGLGLSVSYMIIVKNHKGFFDVESRIQKGTKFMIELPIGENDS